MGPVTLNSNTTVQATYRTEFSGKISGAGGFTKTGGNTVTLSGANTYTGPSVVQVGTLSCSQAAALGSGPLSISNGAVVNLNYSGTRTISALTLGGTNMPRGVYGSTSSSATYKDAHFSGNGTVTVPALITITNTPAAAITNSAAALNSRLACNGTNAGVVAYWNTVNGGTNAALWTNAAYIGAWTNVVSTNLSRTVSGLTPNTTYFFTFRATNTAHTVWATNVLSFTTLPHVPPTPVLLGTAITVSNGVPNFTFGTTAGYKYRLVYKNLLTFISWLPVIAPPDFPLPDGWSVTSAGSPMSLTDTSSAGLAQRFYRLEAANP
jgi:autotransporter-associated beta strand protein